MWSWSLNNALKAIAKEAIRRKTGARGLRAIIEVIMLDVMYELPSRDDIVKCVITKDTVVQGGSPKLYTREGRVITKKKKNLLEEQWDLGIC